MALFIFLYLWESHCDGEALEVKVKVICTDAIYPIRLLFLVVVLFAEDSVHSQLVAYYQAFYVVSFLFVSSALFVFFVVSLGKSSIRKTIIGTVPVSLGVHFLEFLWRWCHSTCCASRAASPPESARKYKPRKRRKFGQSPEQLFEFDFVLMIEWRLCVYVCVCTSTRVDGNLRHITLQN